MKAEPYDAIVIGSGQGNATFDRSRKNRLENRPR